MKQLFLRFCVVGALLATIAPVLTVSASVNADYYNYNTSYYSAPVLSQTSVSIGVNQSANITISGGYAPYTMFSSNPNLFQAVISGNNLLVTGLTNGTGSINICSQGGNTSGCTTLNVSVGLVNYNYNYPYNYYPNNYYTSQLTLSQSSLALTSGTTGTVNISGNGPYYISSNSTPNVASANISGGILSVTALNYGSDTISVCQNTGQCVSLYVTVAYNGNVNNGGVVQPAITFSQTNPTLYIGQSMVVSVYGLTPTTYNNYNYANNYYVAYNSNSSALQASLSGSSLTIQGLSNSNAVLVICTSSTNCGALAVTIGGSQYYTPYTPYVQYNTPPVTTGNWSVCANEDQYCAFTGTRTVQYGANGAYVYRTVTNGTICSNSLFGDPIFGVAKRCSIGG